MAPQDKRCCRATGKRPCGADCPGEPSNGRAGSDLTCARPVVGSGVSGTCELRRAPLSPHSQTIRGRTSGRAGRGKGSCTDGTRDGSKQPEGGSRSRSSCRQIPEHFRGSAGFQRRSRRNPSIRIRGGCEPAVAERSPSCVRPFEWRGNPPPDWIPRTASYRANAGSGGRPVTGPRSCLNAMSGRHRSAYRYCLRIRIARRVTSGGKTAGLPGFLPYG
jgi:hypothetical protein